MDFANCRSTNKVLSNYFFVQKYVFQLDGAPWCWLEIYSELKYFKRFISHDNKPKTYKIEEILKKKPKNFLIAKIAHKTF